MVQPWLWGLAIATIIVGAMGAIAAQDLRKLTANLVLVSVGTLVCVSGFTKCKCNGCIIVLLSAFNISECRVIFY